MQPCFDLALLTLSPAHLSKPQDGGWIDFCEGASKHELSSSPRCILAVAPTVISLPFFLPPAQLLQSVFTLLEKEERAQRRTMPPFRDAADPTAQQGSLHGGQPTPLPQTSQSPATKLYKQTRISHRRAPTQRPPFPASFFFSLICITFPTSRFPVNVAVQRTQSRPKSTLSESLPSKCLYFVQGGIITRVGGGEIQQYRG